MIRDGSDLAVMAMRSGVCAPLSGAVGVFSTGILAIPHLDSLLAAWGPLVDLDRRPRAPVAAVAGWGYRLPARRAMAEAVRRGVPYISLEDGFLRSAGQVGIKADPPLSLVIDPVGVYYDASKPSTVEQAIARAAAGHPRLDEALQLIRLMDEANLGKYNLARDWGGDLSLLRRPGFGAVGLGEQRPLVLVVDQSQGDASIAAGGADAATFERMLDAAISENPDAEVVVRIHPDVVAGLRLGHLIEAARRRHLRIFDQPASFSSLARHARRVYVATSQAGLEALIVGTPTTCFGTPFYAGWGLTDDRQPCPRRVARPSLAALVAAAYLDCCSYVDPRSGQACSALDLARLIAAQRVRDDRFAGQTQIVGVPRARRALVAATLGSRHGRLSFACSVRKALARQNKLGGRIAVWSRAEPAGLAASAAIQGSEVWRLDEAPGLTGTLLGGLIGKGVLVADPIGIHYTSLAPSGFEALLEHGQIPDPLVSRAGALRRLFAKWWQARSTPARDGSAPRRLVVLGQRADSPTVVESSPMLTGDEALLAAVRAQHPTAQILYRPDPEGGAAALRPGEQVIHSFDPLLLGGPVDEVHTISADAGFDALLAGLTVVTYGIPFYAGWGLTQDRVNVPWRFRRPSLEELTAVALFLYPTHVELRTGLPLDPMAVAAMAVQSIADLIQEPVAPETAVVHHLATLGGMNVESVVAQDKALRRQPGLVRRDLQRG